ncbi:MAG: alpha/beta hydrolase family protein [Anaerolineae bacterium]
MSGKNTWLPDVLPAPYNDMMRQFFLRSADEMSRHRIPPHSREAWELRRQQLRQALTTALGGFPERTPLEARVTGVHQKVGYRIENVVFESRPGFHVTGSVFVPDDMVRPAPAILCPHGHWAKGRYQDIVKRRCVGLARRGYVTFAVDAVGYVDREPMGHRQSWYLFSAGMTLQGIEAWDNMRAIDYLCSRDDVDPERIGCTGCSGGGNQTMYVSALDERIKASVPVCSVEMIADYMEKGFCTCEGVPAELRVGDLTEITAMIAPRPLLLIHGMLDEGFPILSARMAAARIRDVYRFYLPERFATFESYSGHDYNAEMRQAMYAWFDRWLMGRQTSGEEEEPEDGELRVLPEGLPPGYAGLDSLFVERAARLPAPPEPTTPDQWYSLRQAIVSGLQRVLGGLPQPMELDARVTGVERRQGYRIERFWFRSEPDVIVPACLLLPDGDGPFDVVIYLLANGKAALDQDRALADIGAGKAVLAFDQRGVGETAYDADTLFLSAFALGRPSVAQRAWDTMRAVDYLRRRSDVAQIRLVGAGSLEAAMTALVAAALDRTIANVEIDALPATLRLPYADPAVAPLYLPNLLPVADLADIAALIAPRPLTVGALLGDDLRPLRAAEARQAWEQPLAAYSLLGAADAIAIGAADAT